MEHKDFKFIVFMMFAIVLGLGAAFCYTEHLKDLERSTKCINKVLYYPSESGWISDSPPKSCIELPQKN